LFFLRSNVITCKNFRSFVAIEWNIACASLIRAVYSYDFRVSPMKIGITVHKEGELYVAADPVTGITSQGKTCDEALKSFQEAFELWFEYAEAWEKERALNGEPVATLVLDLKI
jgi:predicted RNase H-like HicB family nuclease